MKGRRGLAILDGDLALCTGAQPWRPCAEEPLQDSNRGSRARGEDLGRAFWLVFPRLVLHFSKILIVYVISRELQEFSDFQDAAVARDSRVDPSPGLESLFPLMATSSQECFFYCVSTNKYIMFQIVSAEMNRMDLAVLAMSCES